jgi:pimeloyl-ACP methyl ester carboxylesterase
MKCGAERVHATQCGRTLTNMSRRSPIGPPPYQRLALEQLAVWEYGSFLAASPFMGFIAKGDGHAVLVLPGFTTSDRSTELLRAVLARNGHAAQGWKLGRNMGAHPTILRGMEHRLLDLRRTTRRRVSLVGWSLGGIFARELARRHPDAVRTVITLASPYRFRGGDRSHASALYDSVAPPVDPFLRDIPPEEDRPPLPVPATSIYTRTDGIVRWHTCIDTIGPRRENIEVFGTHSGLSYNITAAIAIADRLACPEGAWRPFRAPVRFAHLYPPPVSWTPAAERAARLAT